MQATEMLVSAPNSKKRLLIFAHVPPPVHGVSLVSQRLFDSEYLQRTFALELLPISFSSDIANLNQFGFGKAFLSVRLMVKLVWCVLRRRPHAVYFTPVPAGPAFYRDAVYVFAMKLLRIKCIFHLHGVGIKAFSRKGVNRLLYRFVFRGARVIILSHLLHDDIAEFVSLEDCCIVPNGIPDCRPSAVDEKGHNLEARCDPPVILFLSNLVEAKGPLTLVQALIRLKRAGVNFRSVIAGAVQQLELFEELLRLRDEFGLDKCLEFPGPVFGEKKEQLFEQGDIFVFPTWNEAFGLVILEAMQHRLPVITTPIGALPEIVEDGITGYLVPVRDVESLEKRLGELLNDKGKRQRMGTEARKRFEQRYSFSNFERAMAECFSRVVEQDGK